ncbi:hypothetical protein ACI65C_013831 [Semiaphis heraclei]
MNAPIFKKWFIDMLNNLEEPCIIVMDNASYHSVLSINYPKSNAIKSSIQQWLREKGVDFSPLETVKHCHKLQDDDFIKEGLRDEILAPIILTINPDDSSDSDSDNEDF